MKQILIISMALISMASFANSEQEQCKEQATAAVDAVKFAATSLVGISEKEKELALSKAQSLSELMAKGRYCEALQMATTK